MHDSTRIRVSALTGVLLRPIREAVSPHGVGGYVCFLAMSLYIRVYAVACTRIGGYCYTEAEGQSRVMHSITDGLAWHNWPYTYFVGNMLSTTSGGLATLWQGGHT